MKVGLVGLGKMGHQLVVRWRAAGHDVTVLDINPEAMKRAVAEGAEAATDRADLLAKLGDAPVVWMMIPASLVDTEVEAWLQVLKPGAILVDGGNSDFRLTLKRAAAAKQQQVEFADVGTSGGVYGIRQGFSMMIGGDAAAIAKITPLIEPLAQKQGWHHFGPAGAGHFVKMTHNGVEYGMMQAFAEGYRLLKDNHYFPGLDLHAVATVWQHGSVVQSFLNELTEGVLAANPELKGIEGVVAESGEARWTLEAAKEEGIEMPVIQASYDVRLQSQQGKTHFGTKLLAAMRNAFGGHHLNIRK